MPTDSAEFDPTPGFTSPTHEYGVPVGTAAYNNQFLTEAVQELLASTVAYRQRGVTLSGGQGLLPSGSVLAQQTTTGLYFLHDHTQSDGRQIPIGVLRDARDTGGGTNGPGGATTTSPAGKVSTNVQGNLVWSGALNASMISGTDTSSLTTGFGGGIGSGTGGAYVTGGMLQKGRLQAGNATNSSNAQPFPGSPFDSSEGNIFVFLWVACLSILQAANRRGEHKLQRWR